MRKGRVKTLEKCITPNQDRCICFTSEQKTTYLKAIKKKFLTGVPISKSAKPKCTCGYKPLSLAKSREKLAEIKKQFLGAYQ